MKKFIVFCIIVCTVFISYLLYKMEILEDFQRVYTSELLEDSVAKNTYSNNSSNENTESKDKLIQPILIKRNIEKARFLVDNGIEVQTVSLHINEVDKVIRGTFPKVVGFLDNEKEEKINDLIIIDFKQGIIDVIKSTPGSNFNGNTFNIWLNSNNILCFSQDISYTIGSKYYHFEKGFVYNLASGEKLTLREIFAKDTDYVGILNKLVVEEILNNSMEEEVLKEPFSSIKEDNNYYICQDKLTLFFQKGTSGFVKDIQISIPLWKIDNYITAMELSQSPLPLYEKDKLMVKRNNLQYENGHIKIEKDKYILRITYPKFLSYYDKSAMEFLNSALNKRIKDLQTIKYEARVNNEDFIKEKTNFVIENNIYCNAYGKISIVETINGGSYPVGEISNVLFIDLINKKELNTKSFVKNYIKKEKNVEKLFVNKINMNLNENFLRYGVNIGSKQTFKLKLDDILNKGIICFGEKNMTLHFNKSSINSFGRGIKVDINIKEVLGKSLEELFNSF